MVEVTIKYINNWDVILLNKEQYYGLLQAINIEKNWFVFDNCLSKSTQAINLNNVLYWRVSAEEF